MRDQEMLGLAEAYTKIYNQADNDISEAPQFSRNYGDPAAAKWNAQMQVFNARGNRGEMSPPAIPSGYRWNPKAGTIVSVTRGGSSPTAKLAPTAKPTATKPRLTDAEIDRKYGVNEPPGDEFAAARRNTKPVVAKPTPTPVAKPTAKPAPTPVAKPTAKPASAPTPVAKPTAKPASAPTPTAKPAPTPTAKPVATLPPTAPSSSPSSQLVDLQKMRIASQMRQKGANVVSTQLASFDPFDIIKGHLLDEGFADTEEAALAIMMNMSECWCMSILNKSSFV